MALLPDWTGSFDAVPAYSEFRIYSGGTTCTPPISTNHTLAQLIQQDSVTKRHGTFSGKVVLRNGDHINNSCAKDGVQLYGPQNITNGSEMWYGWSYRFPTGGITSTSFNGIAEWGVADGNYHPQYLVLALQARLAVGGAVNLNLELQTGHKAGPGGSDFNPTPPNGYKAVETLIGPSGPRPNTLDKWHDFYAHIIFNAQTNGTMEIWHREEGLSWEKLYSNLNNGTALINRAPHPTLNWNDAYGAPGQSGSPMGTQHVGFYRDTANITDTYWVDVNARRSSETAILAEFGAAAPIAEPPAPASGHVRIGNATPTTGLTSTADADFKRVIKRGIGSTNTVAFDQGYVYMAGPSSGGAQLLRMVVYDDDGAGGNPGSLLGLSDQVSLAQGAAAAWVSYPFSTPAIGAGDLFYIGFHSGGTGVSSYGYQNVSGGGWRLGDTYADGTTNPFGLNPLVLAIEPAVVADYTISGDTTAPVVQSKNIQGLSLQLHYNEPLDPASIPSAASFIAKVNQTTVTVLDPLSVSGADVFLTLQNPVLDVDLVTLSYTQPGSSAIQDLALNKAISFNNSPVTNDTQPVGKRRVTPVSRVGTARRVDPTDRRTGEGGGM